MDRDDERREELQGGQSEASGGNRLGRQGWHRGYPERRIAGVCSALARQLGVPLTLVRAGFLLGAVMPPFARLSIALYLVLWFLLPAGPDRPSALDRLVEAGSALFGERRHRARRAQSPSRP